jgi:adenosylhomocysteine nucleosidase
MNRQPPATPPALPAAGVSPSAPTAPTAIIAPLAAELAGVLAATAVRRTLRVPVEARPGGGPWHQSARWRRWGWGHRSSRWTVTLGRLAGEDVALMATGDGPAAAAAGLEALLAAVRPRRLLAIGVAGGLTPGLAEGTLVAARQVVAGDGARVPREPDAAWLAAALSGGAVAGAVVSADRILADPAARQAVLGQALPMPATTAMPATTPLPARTVPAAMPGAIAVVDLESVAYARIAAARSLPYLVVRAVLDPADERLPLDFEACRDRGGRVSNARVLARALARPRSLGKLWRLRTRVRDAAAALAALAERLVPAPANGVPARAGDAAATVDMRREIPAAAAGRRTA